MNNYQNPNQPWHVHLRHWAIMKLCSNRVSVIANLRITQGDSRLLGKKPDSTSLLVYNCDIEIPAQVSMAGLPLTEVPHE